MDSEQVSESPIVSSVRAHNAAALLDSKQALGETTLIIDPSAIVSVCRFLKNDEKFVRLCAITGLDWHPMEPRFEVVYLLHSLDRNERVRIKCPLPGDKPEIGSVTGIWKGANWYERETFDLYGIVFLNHPRLNRIMMPDEWEGHPLRKDFPVYGNKYTYKDE